MAWAGTGAFASLAERALLSYPTSVTVTNLALDSAYSYGVGGDAVAFLLNGGLEGPVDGVWLRAASFAGTWASTDGVIDIEIREVDGAIANKPGALVTNGSTTMTLSGTAGWHKATFTTPPVLVAEKAYYLVVGDADGGVTNFVTIGRSITPVAAFAALTTTADGFITPTSVASIAGTFGIDVGGQFVGAPISSIATVATGLQKRGFRIKPPVPLQLVGLLNSSDSGNLTNGQWKVYLTSQLPSDTPQRTFTQFDANWARANVFHAIFPPDEWFTLNADTAYYVVQDPGSTRTTPRKCSTGAIDASASAAELKAFWPLEGEVYWVADSGGAWVEEADAYPMMGLALKPVVTLGGGTRRRNTSMMMG